MPELYRKRLIPSECIHLKNDTIVSISDGHIITRWKTLHPKEEFSYGISYYVVKHGWKSANFIRRTERSLIFTVILLTQAMIKIPTLIFLPICLPMLLLKMTVLSALWI